MRYCPLPSVVADRTFSRRTGLVAATVTSGSTEPEVSLTVPAMAACAKTGDGMVTDTHAISAAMPAVTPEAPCGGRGRDGQLSTFPVFMSELAGEGSAALKSAGHLPPAAFTPTVRIGSPLTFPCARKPGVGFRLDFGHKTFISDLSSSLLEPVDGAHRAVGRAPRNPPVSGGYR